MAAISQRGQQSPLDRSTGVLAPKLLGKSYPALTFLEQKSDQNAWICVQDVSSSSRVPLASSCLLLCLGFLEGRDFSLCPTPAVPGT